jgi:REP element-mobilizing transposase RayT
MTVRKSTPTNSSVDRGQSVDRGTGVPPVSGLTQFHRTRRNLPHWNDPTAVYFITWDSAKGVVLSEDEKSITLQAILHWDRDRWLVHAAVVMPDHVQLLVQPLRVPNSDPPAWFELESLIHSVKSYSAHQINKHLRKSGVVWQDERYDRVVRDDNEYEQTWEYICANPVEAGLEKSADEYRWYHRMRDDKTHRRDAGATVNLGLWLCCLTGLYCSANGASIADEVAAAPEIQESPITDADREHWSFRPLVRPEVPGVKDAGWCRNPIDRFVLAKLEAAGLRPSGPADKVTLIRRVTFDLTGLPPTPDDVDEFVRDESPDANDKLLDRLLASPAYGERWAQHWLDLARFAETDGFEHDFERPNAWRYRDWVIDALNRDVPLDEFVRMQIAGDEFAPGDAAAAIATGFLLCGPDMPDINDQDERRHSFLNDMAGTVGSALLGLQVGCAACHDHKFDPISQADFYRLRAFFEPAEIFKDHPIELAAPGGAKPQADRIARVRKLEAEIDEVENAVRQRLRAENPDFQPKPSDIVKAFSDDEKTRHGDATAALAKLKNDSRLPPIPLARVMFEGSAKVKPSRLMIRGDFRRPGPEVSPAYPRIANAVGVAVNKPEPAAPSTGRRTQFANWVTRPDNPLFARVLVNRIWQFHFGHGVSRTPSDFGLMGDEPSHPELLDWLACELSQSRVESRESRENTTTQPWSLKRMHKLMLTSATYRQASSAEHGVRSAESEKATTQSVIPPSALPTPHSPDPDNRLLSHLNRQRLDGESIRDAMLFAGDRLSDRRGGPGVRPPLPEKLVATLLKKQWEVSSDEEDHRRRSVYLFVRRNLRFPLFEAFDRPDTNASCPRRNRSTIAPQALILLNSEFSHAAAKDFGAAVVAKAGSDPAAQIDLAYRRALGRSPTADERQLALDFLVKPSDLADLCLALFNLNEFVYVD